MLPKTLTTLSVLLVIVLSTSCTLIPTHAAPTAGLPNPASVFCEQSGGKLDLRPDASGSVSGVCTFPDGSECEEWAFSRNECQPGDSLTKPAPTASPQAAAPTDEVASDGWQVYRSAALGYSFHYPADTHIIQNDDPLKSIAIGPVKEGESWPSITLSHPTDREEYRLAEGVNLLQWLTDHNLLGDDRAPDVQIAGTTAIHLRHERSPQSFAYDRYYYAHAGQLYMLVIGHVDDKEDWALYNHFLQSFQFD